MKKNNKENDSVSKAVLACGGKVKGKKQKLESGGKVVFDYNKLSPEQQATFNNLSTEEQTQYINNVNSGGSSVSNVASTTGEVTGMIGMIQSVAGELKGEEDEYGGTSNELTSFFEGIEDVGGNIEDAENRWEEGDYAGAIGSFFNPGFSESWFDDEKAAEEKEKENQQKMSAAQMEYRAKNKYQKGGEIPKDQPVDDYELARQPNPSQQITDYIRISAESDPEIKKNLDSIKGSYYTPIGNDKEGKTVNTWRKDTSNNQGSFTPNEWNNQTLENTKNIVKDHFGKEFDQKEYNKDPEGYLSTIISEGTTVKNSPYGESAQFKLSKDSTGKVTYKYGRYNPNKKQELDTKQGAKEGGEIVGEGTGKSDSINAELPQGSYIVPADAPKSITDRLLKYMKYDEATLNHSDGKKVKVSDGEIFIPPQDVSKADEYVRRMGYDNGLDELAPNAKYKMSERPGYVDGGVIDQYAGTIGGLGQIALAMFESSKNEEPKSDTEQLLRNLSNEVRLRAEYGLNPYERTEAENAIERSFAAERNIINNVSGGSLDVVMNNSAAAAMRMNNSKLSLEVASQKIQEDKTRYADELTLKAIQAHDEDFKRKYNKYLGTEEDIAGLINAGIGNVVGQSQLNSQKTMMEGEREKDRSMWTSLGSNLVKSGQQTTTEQTTTTQQTATDPILEIIKQDTSWINKYDNQVKGVN